MDIKPWHHLKNLTVKKKDYDPDNDEVRKSYAPYMINRFISAIEAYVPVVDQINRYTGSIPNETHYRYFQSVLPKRDMPFVKIYGQELKKKKDVLEEEKLTLQEYFECGRKEVEGHLKILSDKELNDILNIFKKK